MTSIDNRKDLLMLLLYEEGGSNDIAEPIEGRTRLMKLVFLLDMELDLQRDLQIDRPYKFEAYDYGPFSKDLLNDLDFLENMGLIKSDSKGLASPMDQDEEENLTQLISIGELEQEATSVYEQQTFSLTERGRQFVESELIPGAPEKVREGIRRIKKDYATLSLTSLLRYVYAKYPEAAKNTKLEYLTS